MVAMNQSILPVSLVSTVWNDLEGCEVFFRQMCEQSKFPEEIIITDAGSSDGTWEFLQAESSRVRPWRLVLLQDAKCNVARGRNLAIAKANNEIIASTDIGCEWDREWLEELVKHLFEKPDMQMVAGSWGVRFAELKGPWALTEWALKGGKHESVAEAVTFASSRSIAYRKSVWESIGGYAEDLTLAGDDTVFGHMMNLSKIKPAAAPQIRCYWHRHETLRGFSKENLRNFIGEGEAGIGHRHFFLVGGRLVIEFLSLLAGVVSALLGFEGTWSLICLLPFFISLFLRIRVWSRAVKILKDLKIFRPCLRVIAFDMLLRWQGLRGYLTGWFQGNRKCKDVRGRLQKMRLAQND
jgi:glycosyltransferase involved in cell wall biosynthesis